MFQFQKHLGKYIGKVVLCCAVLNIDLIRDQFFAYKMMLYVNVFSAAVINKIVQVIDHTLSIDIEFGGSQVWDADFGSESSQPYDLMCC
jgi:hypothetical protein